MEVAEENSIILNKIRTNSSVTNNSDMEKKLTNITEYPIKQISKEQTVDTTSFGTESLFKLSSPSAPL
jgi:hypothetical protein